MPTQSVTLVILGASGDLTHRLLLPGLGTLLRAKPDYDIRLIGASSDDLTVSAAPSPKAAAAPSARTRWRRRPGSCP